MLKRENWFAWAVIGALLILTIYWIALRYEQRSVDERLQRISRVQVQELDRQLKQFSFVPKLLADDFYIKQVLGDGDPLPLEAANQRLSQTQRESGLDFAFLMNVEGLTVASSNWDQPVSFVGKNYAFRPYFQEAVKGGSATFFAVGATTGIPGYFIAEPVFAANKVAGVVVAKVALDVLVDAWKEQPFHSTVFDEFGVIILATKNDWLYTPTTKLDKSALDQVIDERRYQLQPRQLGSLVKISNENRGIIDSLESSYRVLSQPMQLEPWIFNVLYDNQQVRLSALKMTGGVVAALSLAMLMFWVYRQQKRMTASEQRNARELEEKVRLRTEELAEVQQALISESNFAMLGRMSAAINHEVNQPLASLRLNLASLRKMIESKSPDSKDILQTVVDSDRTTKRISRVITSLRSITRKKDAGFQRLSVSDLLRETERIIRHERPSMSSYLSFVDPEQEVMVEGNEILLQQALLNLLYNAMDSTLNVDQPSIVLSVSANKFGAARAAEDQTELSINITDNGAGVPESVAKVMFQPFHTAKEITGGLGLGLTIARQIAEDHGGSISYIGTEGDCCFSLNLPLAHATGSSADG